MRSSKSRSRSKSNRPRSMGNIVNRVFDSSGPEGKVRGTPQQIIEKYLILARDAQLGNDRVAAENFLQHAEHYTRMLGEAQREMAREQENRRDQQPQQPGPEGHSQGRDRDRREPQGQSSDAAPVIDIADGGGSDSSLVETPEQSADAAQSAPMYSADAAPAHPAADTDKPAPRARSPRKPRKPAGEGKAAERKAPESKPTVRNEADTGNSLDDSGAQSPAAE